MPDMVVWHAYVVTKTHFTRDQIIIMIVTIPQPEAVVCFCVQSKCQYSVKGVATIMSGSYYVFINPY